MIENIPDPSIRRLSAYLRQLEHLRDIGIGCVSSRELATHIKAGAAQVRRDLALFGQFGRPGVGYSVAELIEQIRRILGTENTWRVVVMGAGALADTLLRYPGFAARGFEVVGAVDNDPAKVGTKIGNVTVRHTDELAEVVRKCDAKLAVLAVPADAACEAAQRLADAGIVGILNFATANLETPDGLHVTQVDITAHLEQLSFQVTNR